MTLTTRRTCLLLCLTIVAALGAAHGQSAGARSRLALPNRGADSTTTQLVLVLLGAESCATNAGGALASDFRALKALAYQAALREGLTLRTIGIAVDSLPSAGLAFLTHFGRFDEIVVGGGWANVGAMSYLWNNESTPASIPQVIAVRRTLRILPRVSVLADSVIARWVGVQAIRRASRTPGLTSAWAAPAPAPRPRRNSP